MKLPLYQPDTATASRFLFFTGKGGVGKTSLSCSTALKLVEAGKRVLLVSTDPASNLDEVLETKLTSQPTPIAGAAGLDAMNINPVEAAAAYRERLIGPMRGLLEIEHPHGLSDTDFDALFTKDKHVIFAFHAYPSLIHQLTYRRTNHHNIHVRGYKEEGTITTPFDMTVLNDLDRFHLVMDTIDRLPHTGAKGQTLKRQLEAKLVQHKQYIEKHGQDMPEIRNWKWVVSPISS